MVYRQRFLPTPADKEYVEQLRRRREDLGLSQSELAKRSGLSLTTIWRVENGQRGLSRQAARRIEEILGILASGAHSLATGAQPPFGVGVAPDPQMTSDEKAVLAMYRALPVEDQEAALGRLQKLYAAAAERGRLKPVRVRPGERTDPGTTPEGEGGPKN